LSDARSQREELLSELAGLTNQVSGLQAEIDSRDEKMGGLEAAAEQANKGVCGHGNYNQRMSGNQQ
jgi:peptidoglycan hydrolase CwlO-like protein